MQRKRLVPLIAILLSLFILRTSAIAVQPQCPPDTLLRPLDNPSPTLSDYFGRAISMSGELAVIGATGEDPGGIGDAGLAYVMNARTGALVATLDSPSPSIGGVFGSKVAISGTLAVVLGSNKGHVFDATNGDLIAPLILPAGSGFGSIGISGEAVIVGSPGAILSGSVRPGAAYIFNARTGASVWTLNHPAPADDDEFGNSVAISGNFAVVGARAVDTIVELNVGAAYVFNTLTGELLWTLNNPEPGLNAVFGSLVAMSDNLAAVVAARSDDVYVFDVTTGELKSTFRPFAFSLDSVSISGNLGIVGDHGYENAQIFNATTGALLKTLSGPVPDAGLGRSVALSGNLAVVSSDFNPGGIRDAGGAFVFTCESLIPTSTPSPTPSDTPSPTPTDTPSPTPSGTPTPPPSPTSEPCVRDRLLHTLSDPTLVSANGLGKNVAVSGNIVVMGAKTSEGGIAYTFDARTGTLITALNNPLPTEEDTFGVSVAIDGNVVVVGASKDDTGAEDAGGAYAFDAISGELIATFTDPSPAADGNFGNSVAVSGSMAFVGAIRNGAGKAYVFDVATGTLIRTLENPNPSYLDLFGYSVAIDSNVVVVGAIWEDAGASSAGIAYVFNAITGDLITTLNNPTPEEGDWFGYSVSISGNVIVVGAVSDNEGAAHAGAAYVFNAETGALNATINDPSPAAGEGFGSSISISGDIVLVGASFKNVGSIDSGAAFLFNATGGALITHLNDPVLFSGNFGRAVALSNNFAVVGRGSGTASIYTCESLIPTITPTPTPSATPTPSPTVTPTETPTPGPCAPDALLHPLNNPAPTVEDHFGWSVAISENLAVVGAFEDDAGENDAGTGYVLDVSTGALVSTLNNPYPEEGDAFGISVAISGNLAVVGASSDYFGATDAGTVYVFDATTGAFISVLLNPAPAAGDHFGNSVGISGNLAVVGAVRDGVDPSDTGTAYVFNASTGALIATLNNPAPTVGDLFGVSVAISGNVAVVGAYHDDAGAPDAGTAYVFNATTGALTATLNNPAPQEGDCFGWSVSVSGNVSIVGAHEDDPGGINNAGSAYVFDTTTGALVATLNNPAPSQDDFFGVSVAIDGGFAAVGANSEDSGGLNGAGAAYIFDAATGALAATLKNPDPTADDRFGISVGFSRDVAVVGAWEDSPGGVDEAGSAYTFTCARLIESRILAYLLGFIADPAALDINGDGVVDVADLLVN